MITSVITGVRALKCRFKSQKGQSLVEYTLILSFVSVLSVVVMTVLGVQLRGIFFSILNALAVARYTI
jgi:Flp pilus assembly pilin Flp